MSGQVTEEFGLPLSLTFDHAEVDGVDGAEFLERLTEHVVAPE